MKEIDLYCIVVFISVQLVFSLRDPINFASNGPYHVASVVVYVDVDIIVSSTVTLNVLYIILLAIFPVPPQYLQWQLLREIFHLLNNYDLL